MNVKDAELLFSVLATIEACRTYEYWKNIRDLVQEDRRLYVYGEWEAINDALFDYSLVSLRKIDDFLTDNNRRNSDDIRYCDFGISKEKVLSGNVSIIPRDIRTRINKCIAHTTSLGQAEVEDLEEFQKVLELATPTLIRLIGEVNQLLNSKNLILNDYEY